MPQVAPVILNRFLRPYSFESVRSITQSGLKCPHQEPISPKKFRAAKLTSEVPGPKKFELVRGFLPGGVFYKKSLPDFMLRAREIYGDFYFVPGMFGKPGLFVSFNPDDIPLVIHSEGTWPKRRGVGTLNYHRKYYRNEVFKGITGLFGSNGEEWGNLRSKVNPIIMQPLNVRVYIGKMQEVNREFLQRIREIRDPATLEVPSNFEDEICRGMFESIAVVALNQQIGLIRKNRDNPDVEALFKSIRTIFTLIYDLDVLPSMWRLIKTPKFLKMMEAMNTMTDIISKYINQAVDGLEQDAPRNDGERSIFEKLLQIDRRYAVVMAIDLLMGGVDSTSSTLAGILLYIAKNPDKQEKLRQELRSVLPEKGSLFTSDNMGNLPYLRACIKEGMRLHPITSGVFRTTGADLVLSGYQIPKDCDLIICSNELLLEDKYYPKAKKFIPERWIRSEEDQCAPKNPFIYAPFGSGPRVCVAKRLVDMEMSITVGQLVRNFYIEFNYPTENAFKTYLIRNPAIPLKFKFIEVEN